VFNIIHYTILYLSIVLEDSYKEQDARVHEETLKEDKNRERERGEREREILVFLGEISHVMLGFSLVRHKVCAMQVNPREEHDIGGDDGLFYSSCCSTRVSTLVEDIESGLMPCMI
jgi:hypothetical protein